MAVPKRKPLALLRRDLLCLAEPRTPAATARSPADHRGKDAPADVESLRQFPSPTLPHTHCAESSDRESPVQHQKLVYKWKNSRPLPATNACSMSDFPRVTDA